MLKKNLNNSIIFHIIRLSETLKKHGDLLTEKHGITTQQWIIMLLLAKDPNIIYLQEHPTDKPLLAKELADAMNVSRANITNLLNVLLEKKLVEQIFDGQDKRNKRITLSPKGKKVVEELELPRNKRNNELFKKFTKEEKLSFIKFIQTALISLKGDMEQKKLKRN
jgi:DNA-binding MarR family transcriptional regulator